jgi:hypothetical protein
VTWNTLPPADPSSIGVIGPVTVGAWAQVDVSSLVTGDGTYSLEIAKTASNAAFYSTKEGTPGFAAQLVVTLS